MRKQTIFVSALAVSLALPMAVVADTQGRGNGNGQDRAEDGGGRGNDNGGGRGNQGRGNGQDRAERSDADRGNGNGRGNQGRGNGQDPEDRPEVVVREVVRAGDDNNGRGRGNGNGNGRGNDGDRVVVVVRDNDDVRDVLRDLERRGDNDRRDAVREFERRLDGRDLRVVRDRDGRDYIVLVRDDDRHLIDGCPPGLAWRNNGCLPPGQARRMERAHYDTWLWDRRDDDFRYNYVDGYVYQTRQDGGLAGWLPVLAGALGMNNVWPQQYRYEPVPQYYNSYYGLGDRYDYR